MDKYILKNKKVTREPSLLKWAKWFETADRIIGRTIVGKETVSTVFLGIDHNLGGKKLHLFETMIFPDGELYKRYSTWKEAEEGHNIAVEVLKKGL